MVLKLIVFIYVNIFLSTIRCKDDDVGEIVFAETTTEYRTFKTDIPESDVEQAQNIDYGKYTTQTFTYYNNQFLSPVGLKVEPCFDSHIKCLLTIAVPKQVCTVNIDDDYYEGYRNFDTYCDAYLDNCLRKMRFWRILDYGICHHRFGKRPFQVIPTRRRNSPKFRNVLNGFQAHRFVINN